MTATVNPRFFTVDTARTAGLKSAALRALRRAQREAATVEARDAEASNTFALIAEGRSTVARALDSKSTAVRALLSIEAVKQAEILAKAERNEPALFKTLVEASSKLFGWDKSDTPSCLIQNNYLGEIAPQPVVSCGVPVEEVVNITQPQSELNGVKLLQ